MTDSSLPELRLQTVAEATPVVPGAGAAGADDARLVELACEGDAAAFEALMRRHNRLLFRTARGIARDAAQAQDVVQDTWLHAFTRLESWRGEAKLSTWLARIAIHLALDAERQRGRTVSLDADDEFDPQAGAATRTPRETMMSLRAPEQDAPDQAAERAELRRMLQAAIEALPPGYRSVFMLRAVQGMSVDETAYCLRVSDAVVKTRLLRARALLRRALGRHLDVGASDAFAFDGPRCDAVVAHVLAGLDRLGRIRRH